ncbi:MAG TPA: DpnI domain-containing protein [Thermoanaerobaculia bacterium]|nr:DpnI domain-containing protein [Thermoanaerobaculia bacterium]
MPTENQILGQKGEELVVKSCHCPRCKRKRTLKRLPKNFKCADVVCDFCGYLAQVKTATAKSVDHLPDRILGAAWGVQSERMAAGIYLPLFIVLVTGRQSSIFYLSTDAQTPEMFVARKPLSEKARRAGWQGFVYDLRKVRSSAIRLA